MTDRDTAMKYMDEKNFPEALTIFQKLLLKTPDDGGVLYMAGQCARFTNDLETALEYLKKSSQVLDQDASVFLALGIAFQLDGNYEEATAALRTAIKLEPAMIPAYNSLGLTLKKTGRFKQAIECYSAGLEQYINDITDLLKNAHTSDTIVNGKNTRIIEMSYFEEIEKKLRSDVLYSVLLNNIGVCLIELGDKNAAREKFQESIAMTPEGYNYPDPTYHLNTLK